MLNWRHFVSPGCELEPKPIWNETEPESRRLAQKVTVIRVLKNKHLPAEPSFVVTSLRGEEVAVSALWFERMIHP